jgi:hypothetical protein
MGHTDVASRVTFLGQFTGEELVEFGAEDTIGHEFSFLADLSGHFECWVCILSQELLERPAEIEEYLALAGEIVGDDADDTEAKCDRVA